MRVKEKEEEQLAQLAQEKVAVDLQLQSLQQSCESMRVELGRRREEIEGSAPQSYHISVETVSLE